MAFAPPRTRLPEVDFDGSSRASSRGGPRTRAPAHVPLRRPGGSARSSMPGESASVEGSDLLFAMGAEGAVAASRQVSRDTLDLLPGSHVYTADDMEVLESIILHADNALRDERRQDPGAQMSLMKMLRSYEHILRKRGISIQDDTHFYRFLLKLSLDPREDWVLKFREAQRGVTDPTRPPAADRASLTMSRDDAIPVRDPGPVVGPDGRLHSTTLHGVGILGELPRRPFSLGKGMTEDDALVYAAYKTMARVIRTWKRFVKTSHVTKERAVASWAKAIAFWEQSAKARVVLQLRRALNLVADKEARSDQLRVRQIMRAGLAGLRRGVATRKFELHQLSAALEFWARQTLQRRFWGWLGVVDASRLPPLTHPVAIRAAFRWMGISLGINCHGMARALPNGVITEVIDPNAGSTLQQFWRPTRRPIALRATGTLNQWTVRAFFRAWHARTDELCVFRVKREDRILHRCIGAWRESALAWRAEREVLGAVLERRGLVVKRTAFAVWREAADRRHDLRERARSLVLTRATRLLSQAWHVWAGSVSSMRLENRAYAHYQARLCRHIVIRWHAYVGSHRTQQRIADHALQHYATHLEREAFWSWRQFVRGVKLSRRMNQTADAARGLGLLRKMWHQWKNSFSWQTNRDDQREVAQGFSRHEVLHRAFREWFNVSRQLKKIRLSNELCEAYTRRKIITGAFHDWRHHFVQKRKHDVERKIAERYWVEKLCRGVFYRWRMRHADTHADIWYRKKRLPGLFAHWKAARGDHAIEMGRRDFASAASAKITKKRVLQAWIRYVRYWRHVSEVGSVMARHSDHGRMVEAFRTWHAETAWRLERRQQLSVVLDRIVRRAALRDWRDAIADIHAYRGQMVLAAKIYDMHLMSGALADWRTARNEQVKGRRVLAHWRNGSLVRAFREWRTYTLRNRHVKQTIASMAFRRASDLLSDALRTWSDWVAARKDLRTRGEHAVAVYEDRLKRASWQIWRGTAGDKHFDRTMYSKAVQLLVGGRLARAFHTWRDYCAGRAEIRRKVRGAVQQKLFGMQARAFHALREYAVKSKLVKRLERDYVQARTVRLERNALSLWRDETRLRRGRRERAAKALGKMRLYGVARAFSSWREYSQRQARNKQVLVPLLARKMHGSMANAFHIWLETTRRAKHVKHVADRSLKRLLNRALANAFGTWREQAMRSHALKEMERKMESDGRRDLLVRAWRGWHAACHEKRGDREKLRKAVMRLRNGTLARAFERWQIYRERSKELKRSAALVRALPLRRFFADWKEEHRRRVVMRRALLRVRNASMARAFASWYETVQAQRNINGLVKEIQDHWEHRRLQRIFIEWRATAFDRQRDRRRLGKAVGYMQASQLARAWNTWRDWVGDSKRTQRWDEQVVTFQRTGAIRGAFRAWLGAYRDSRTMRKKLAFAVNAFAGRQQYGCFARWREYVEEQKEERAKMRRALAAWQQRIARAALNQWMQYAQWSQTANRKLSRVVRMWQGNVLSLAFNQWRDHVNDLRRIKEGGNITQKSLLAQSWRQWRDQLRRKRQIQDGSAIQSHFVMKRAFRLWRQYQTSFREDQLVLLRKAVGFWNKGILEAGLLAFKENVANAHRLRGVIKRLLNAKLSRAFNAWAEHMKMKKHLRKLQTAFEHRRNLDLTRELFVDWRQQVEKRRSTKALRVRVLGRLQNNTLARAFATWTEYTSAVRGIKQMVLRRLLVDQRRVLVAWREFTAKQRYLRALLEARETKQRTRDLRAVFATWRKAHRDSAKTRAETLETFGKFWGIWRERAREAATDKQGVALVNRGIKGDAGKRTRAVTVLLRWRNFALARAFDAWYAETHHGKRTRSLEAMGEEFEARRLVLSCWRDWRAAQENNRKVRHALGFWLQAQKSAALARWREFVVQSKEAKHRARRAMMFWTKNTQAIYFGALATYTARMKYARQFADDRYNAREDAIRRDAFNDWLQRFRTSRANRQYDALTSTFRRKTILGDALRTWRENVQESIREANQHGSLTDRLRLLRLRHRFTEWHEFARTSARHKQIINMIMGRKKEMTLQRAFTVWHSWTQRAKFLDQRLAAWQARFPVGVARVWWQRWVDRKHGKVRHSQGMEMAIAHHKRRTMGEAFATWHQWSTDARFSKRKVLEFITGSVMPRYFRRWREYVEEQKVEKAKIARVFKHYNNLALTKCFNTWKEYTDERRAIKERVLRMMLDRRDYTLRDHFLEWRRVSQRERGLNDRGLAFVTKTNTAQMRRTMETWRAAHARALKIKEVSRKALLHWRMASAAAAFRAWQGFVAYKKRVLAESLETLLGRRTRTCFVTWRENILQQKALREAEVEWAATSRRRLLVDAWRTWVSGHREASIMRVRLTAVVGRMRNLSLAMAFSRWQEFTQESLMFKRAVKAFQHTAERRAFNQWVAFTQESKYERGAAMHERFLRLRAFKRWHAMFTVAGALGTMNRRAVLAHTFHTWRNNIKEGNEMDARIKQVEDRVNTGIVRRALAIWSKRAGLERTHDHVLRRRCFTRWKQNFKAHQTMRAWMQSTTRKLEGSMLQRLFTAWREAAVVGREERREERLDRKLARHLRSKFAVRLDVVFSAWADYAATRSAQRRAADAFERAHVARRVLVTWRERWAASRRDYGGTSTADALYAARLRGRTFRQIADTWRARRRMRNIIDTLTGNTERKLLLWGMRAFKQARAERLTSRIRSVQTLAFNHTLGAHWAAWRGVVAKKRAAHMVVRQREHELRVQTQAVVFQAWLRHVRATRDDRQAAMAAAAREEEDTIRRYFAVWRARYNIAAAGANRGRATVLVQRTTRRRLLAEAFREWRRRCFEVRMRRRTLERVWATWRQATGKRKQLLAWALRTWQKRAMGHASDVSRDQTAEHFRYRNVLARAFGAWRGAARTRSVRMAAVEPVVVDLGALALGRRILAAWRDITFGNNAWQESVAGELQRRNSRAAFVLRRHISHGQASLELNPISRHLEQFVARPLARRALRVWRSRANMSVSRRSSRSARF